MPFQTRRRVEFANTDAAGIVHFAAFFLWMESAEHEALRDVGVEILPQGADAVTWPRVSVQCDYHAAARFEDWLWIDVSVSKIGRSSVEYKLEFSRESEDGSRAKIATGRTTSVCCHLREGGGLEKVPIPAPIRQRLEKLS
ncbi:MAG: thioesterase family protein [Planctomycetota bacterium]